jgi:hypothetical protein
MALTFPFFVLVSMMGVLISLVPIPLRGECPDESSNPSSLMPVLGVKMLLGAATRKSLQVIEINPT